MNMNSRSVSSPYSSTEAVAAFMSRVYTWMTGGILLTALVATFLGKSPELVIALVRTPVLYYGMIIAQLVAVVTLSAALGKLSPAVATALYIGYAALTGATLSTIFLLYTHESIASVFLATACGFGGLSLLGYTTKRDLGPVGAFCGMALFGLVGWALLSFIFPSLMGGEGATAYSIIGVLVFAGLTAYDTQKIKSFVTGGAPAGADVAAFEQKAAIFGALMLYLDFINLFLSLLRLIGDRRR